MQRVRNFSCAIVVCMMLGCSTSPQSTAAVGSQAGVSGNSHSQTAAAADANAGQPVAGRGAAGDTQTPAVSAAGQSGAGQSGAGQSGADQRGAGQSGAGQRGTNNAGAGGVSVVAGAGGTPNAGASGVSSAGTDGMSTAGAGGASGQNSGGSGPSTDPGETPEPTKACGSGQRAQSGTVRLMNRSYILHVPSGVDASVPLPLVLNFHGYTSTAEAAQRYTAMDMTADEHKFMVAYPEGLSNSFNAGSCCGTSAGSTDDVAFARAIVADVGERACVDRRRVYSTGMSNGGMMSFRLACEASDLFVAIAPVVGSTRVTSCQPPRGVPVISFNGTADTQVRYAQANPLNEQWAMRNQCTGGPMTETHAASSCKVWSNCRDGSEVRVCSLNGMGHCWPGAPTDCRSGSANDDIEANEEMWKFFSRFRHPR